MKFCKSAAYLFGVLTAALLAVSMANASIVTNGDFESLSIAGDPLPYRIVFNGQPDVTGWTVGGVSVDIVDAVKAGNPFWAYDGRQSIDMTGSPGPGSIYQDLDTDPGQLYGLTFFGSHGPFVGGAVDLTVKWEGVIVDTVLTPGFGTWQEYTYTLLATGSWGRLEFSTTIGGNDGPLLDAVSVEPLGTAAVPEPATLAIWGGIGIAGLVASRVRRRR